jgi:hypothetical protein
MYLPIATPPVKVTRSTCGFVSSSSAISRGSPVTTLSISGGRPASYRMSANSRADSGTFSEGLSTIRLLVATLGTTLCATWFIGWLNGVIAVITPSSGVALRVDPALLAVRREVAAEDLAVVLQHLVGAEHQHVATRPAS